MQDCHQAPEGSQQSPFLCQLEKHFFQIDQEGDVSVYILLFMGTLEGAGEERARPDPHSGEPAALSQDEDAGNEARGKANYGGGEGWMPLKDLEMLRKDGKSGNPLPAVPWKPLAKGND